MARASAGMVLVLEPCSPWTPPTSRSCACSLAPATPRPVRRSGLGHAPPARGRPRRRPSPRRPCRGGAGGGLAPRRHHRHPDVRARGAGGARAGGRRRARPALEGPRAAGAPSEASLSALAMSRPLVTPYEPRWGRALGRHLVPVGLLDRFEPEPRGVSDRRKALEAFGARARPAREGGREGPRAGAGDGVPAPGAGAGRRGERRPRPHRAGDRRPPRLRAGGIPSPRQSWPASWSRGTARRRWTTCGRRACGRGRGGGRPLPRPRARAPTLESRPHPRAQGSLPLAAGCLPRARCPLPRAQSSPSFARCPLPLAQASLPLARRPLPRAQASLPLARCLPPRAHAPLPRAACLFPLALGPHPRPVGSFFFARSTARHMYQAATLR